MINLSDKQQQIVDYTEGALLVIAGPGSGKTRALMERIKNLHRFMNGEGRILVLASTNIALDELRLRLKNDVEMTGSFGDVKVSSIHSFCLDMLIRYGLHVGIPWDVSLIANDDDRKAILRESLLNEPLFEEIKLNPTQSNVIISDYLSKISERKRKLTPPEKSNDNDLFFGIYRKYNDLLAAHNAIDYDDILFFSYLILTENQNTVRMFTNMYRYIIIDEAQDLNLAQYWVIKAICADGYKNIMMMGDEKQSINAVNSSSSEYMIDFFVKDFNPTIYTLDENFRSSKNIIQYTNELTDRYEDLSRYVYEGELNIKSFKDEHDEACSVCKTIQHLRTNGHKDIEGNLTYDKIAVIARNKYVLSNVESEFSKKSIPFYYKKTRSDTIFETDYMKAFDYILRLIVNPHDLFHTKLLCKLINKKIIKPNDDQNMDKMLEQLLSGTDFAWLSQAIQGIKPESTLNLEKVVKSLRVNMPRTICDDENYLLQNDIDMGEKYWLRFAKKNKRKEISLAALRNAIAWEYTQKIDVSKGVALLTTDVFDGLEFEVVFVIGLSEGTFPDYRAVKSGGDALNQEKNNMYVAVTRAKRICYLSYPEKKKMPWGGELIQKPSRFIASRLLRGNKEIVQAYQ
ncbi:MAG: ATP-dependent helicase [Deltaproteobacteria bacterium]|jgi:DNA helicase-2/ATP-dependent DNA helicase PcrA|nr:ATP-dependent helicase [Deltaproteobacteria bacterium]